ncbi:MAG: glycoside hydrolase N-terminal domain-containing protein [Roseburia sp.]|nr:glycoside hydrolase N-terminal domain-containing protein [Roseburia sp.]
MAEKSYFGITKRIEAYEMTRNKRYILENTRPASFFCARGKDATPLGNGEMGALVYGGIREEEIILTRHDLWHWGKEHELPDVHDTLEETRAAIDGKNYSYAKEILSKALLEKGYKSEVAVPFPMGKLRLQIGKEAMFYQYKRILDMEHGIVSICYELENGQNRDRYIRDTFVSCVDNVTVFHMKSLDGTTEAAISMEIVDTGKEDTVRMFKEIENSLECQVTNEKLYFGYENDDRKQVGAVVKAISDGGQITYEDNKIIVNCADNFTVLLKTFVGNRECFDEIAAILENLSYSYEELKTRHAEQFAKLFTSCQVWLGEDDSEQYNLSNEELLEQAYKETMSAEFAEKLWAFGRYLFLSGTSTKMNPFPLYGLWNSEYDPPWSQYVANENVEMLYWHINTGGMAEYARPLIHYYYAQIPKMQENAKKLFGCRGIFLSVYTTPINAYINPPVPVIVNWISGAGWLCRHFYEYYKYTGDEKLLKDEILPFMVETAIFYEDYICYESNGEIKLYPSVSPENTPANLIPKDSFRHLNHGMPVVKNATMDFAIMKEVLANLLEVCKTHQVYEKKLGTWEKMLNAIPAYQIYEEGAIKEWMDEELKDQYCHRHMSHLYPVFPGEEIGKHSDKKLYEAFEKSVDLRELSGQVGWSLVHMAAIYSRFGRGDDAMRCLDLIPKGVLLPNFFMLSNDYRAMGVTMEVGQFAPVQLDANLGFVNAVQEMLFRYHCGTLTILPACPSRWIKGSVKGFCFPGGKVDFSWDFWKKEIYVEITMHGNECPELILPENLKSRIVMEM